MANIKSAEKRARQAIKRRQRNRADKGAIHTLRRKLLETIAAGDKEKSREMFKTFCSILDKSLKHGVLKSNTVDRKKSRIAAKLASMK